MKICLNRKVLIKASLVFLLLGVTAQPGYTDNTKSPPIGSFQLTRPDDAGFSQQRLERMTATIEGTLLQKNIPGAVAMIMRDGQVVYQQVFGHTGAESGSQMEMNTIFRIYSMTKPIVSVATMMMWEEGKLQLWHPVHWYLPEFRDVQVAVMDEPGLEIIKTVPVSRPITIQDLLRHTAGLTYGIFGFKNAVRKLYTDSGVEKFPYPGTNKDFVTAIAKLPLLYQPGAQWGYSHATTVLGRLLEVIDDKPLGELLTDRILAPLGMKDTAFWVEEPKQDRIAEGKNDTKGNYPLWLEVSQPLTSESGGGGLVSTALDYALFCQMLLNGGVLRDTRLLSPRTVELMTANHLGPDVGPGDMYLPGAGHGFGLGFKVRTEQGLSGMAGSPGQYSWGGVGGTAFWIDPIQGLVLIFMMQDMENRMLMRNIFQNMAYAAMTK